MKQQYPVPVKNGFLSLKAVFDWYLYFNRLFPEADVSPCMSHDNFISQITYSSSSCTSCSVLKSIELHLLDRNTQDRQHPSDVPSSSNSLLVSSIATNYHLLSVKLRDEWTVTPHTYIDFGTSA